ncbi:MAG TPA: PKD domain-containing protein [Chitinophagaceae bacterium]
MKIIIHFLLFFLIAGSVLFLSCKKETSCEGCKDGNKAPIAIAGPDQVITLPTDSISLDGSASNDPDGTISEWLWQKISGPASFNINNAAISTTVVKALTTGVYQFELKVTDNGGLFAKDTMQVIVNDRSQPNRPPVANAGADMTITLPANPITLDGSASTDPDNNIIGYAWTKISGPSSSFIINASAVQSQVTTLTEGVYQFELRVTDAGGLFDRDTMQVKIDPQPQCPQPSPPPSCTTNCGKIVFVSDRDGNDEIYTCNADGSNVTRLTNDAAEDGDPVWSPEGTRIAFIREGNLCVMNADGSNVVQKTFTSDTKNPAWSPDGNRIAFTDMIDEANNVWWPSIYVMELTSGTVSPLPNSSGSSVEPSPAWSPDGTEIAFDSDWWAWDFIADIHTICPAGGGFTTLTSTFFNDNDYWKPSWSPDGMKLSATIYKMQYMTEHDGSIAVMNADGTGLMIIKTGIVMPMFDQPRTSWSPDGTRIAYTESKTIKWVATNGSASGTIISNGWDADWKH